LKNITLHSNGKLLLSGEYLVMQGALALALPLIKGQSLNISPVHGNRLLWESTDTEGIWFSCEINLNSWDIISTSDPLKASKLIEIIRMAAILNPRFLIHDQGYKVQSNLEFSKEWGWGSSSTLYTNIANWAEIDPFTLYFALENGSGYDIACAHAKQAVLYQLRGKDPVYQEIDFNPPFRANLAFIYSGKKQDTRTSILEFRSEISKHTTESEQITQITKEIADSRKLNDFLYFLKEHEKIISSLLGMKMIQEAEFGDFEGITKSLGAWGGDFLLAASNNGIEYIRQYFQNKGLNIIYGFDQIIRHDGNNNAK